MTEEKQNNQLSRRKFMERTIAAIGGVITAGFAIPGVSYILSPALQEKIENWIFLGSAAKVEPGVPTLMKASIERKTGWITDSVEYAAYVRTEDGENFEAMTNICPHLGCRVRWIDDQELFFCPCHNASFDKNGDVLDGPPPRPLDRYEVKKEDDQIFILGG
mgnify:CR=1 FL=1